MSVIRCSLVLLACLSGVAEAFKCYMCSYDGLSNTDQNWNRKECMNIPDKVSVRYPCNDTGFCTYQETYNLDKGEVTSYYRSCSKTSLGNSCTRDAKRLICTGSCKGDYCNQNDTGHQHENYFTNSSSHISITFFAICGCILISILHKFDIS